jgi:hypothetical protein
MKLLLNFSAILILSTASLAFANSNTSEVCASLQEWQQSQKAVQNPPISQLNSIAVMKVVMDKERAERLKAAEKIVDLYFLEGKKLGSSIQSCLANNPERSNFLYTLNSLFVNRSFDYLKRSQSPRVKKLMALVDKRYESKIPLIQMVNAGSKDPKLAYKAGFHRGSGSIVMDMDLLQPSEWLLVFVHELLHAMDDEMSVAIGEFAKPEVPQFLAQMNSENKNYDTWSLPEQKRSTHWVHAGLGRGLYAEYRAWVPTVLIYQEGLNDRLWGNIDWLDQVINANVNRDPLNKFIYEFLDDRAENPTEGIFSLPIVRDLVIRVRHQVRSTNLYPKLGVLNF